VYRREIPWFLSRSPMQFHIAATDPFGETAASLNGDMSMRILWIHESDILNFFGESLCWSDVGSSDPGTSSAQPGKGSQEPREMQPNQTCGQGVHGPRFCREMGDQNNTLSSRCPI
jgi:hypothetical protein